MFKKSIEKVLKVLTVLPPLLILTLSLLTTIYIYQENQKNFEVDSLKLKKEFLNKNRLEIYNEVHRVQDYINNELSSSRMALKDDLKAKVDEAVLIINGIIKNNQNLPKVQLLEKVKNVLKDIRFNSGRGYFYIYTMSGICVMLPIQEDLEGKSFLNVKDTKGKYITRSIIDSLKQNKDEFMSWWWFKPNNKKQQFEKISYNRYIEKLDIYVGTGEYIVDFENDLKQKILNFIGKIRYSDNNYIFVYDYSGKFLAHPNKDFVNKNLSNVSEFDKYNINEIIKIAKSSEGYITYKSDFFGKYENNVSKTSFIKGFDKWNWAIGTGFYKTKIENEIAYKQKILKQKNRDFLVKMIFISFVITFVLILITLYNTRYLKIKFQKIQNEIEHEINQNNQKDKILFHQSKMASLGEMLQNIAHQWRQPLSIISTAASGMKVKKDYGMLEDSYIDQSVDTIMKSSTYLSKTIDDFRDFFKSDKDLELFDIKDAVNDCLEILNIKLKNMNVTLLNELPSQMYKGYKNELIQVIMNMITNCLDAFENKSSNRVIWLDLKNSNKEIKILIQDNAGGIKEEIIDKVFEPYFTTKHQAQGTGIGLYMSQEIVQKHLDGNISVSNKLVKFNDEENLGACFEIALGKINK